MIVGDIVSWLNAQAPFDTAEDFDNVGLLIGDSKQEITGVMFGLDVTDALLNEALEKSVNMIITHHPFIFHPLKRIDYSTPMGGCLLKILQNKLNVAAVHTNWDQARGGISDTLAEVLGLVQVTTADPYLRIGKLPSPYTVEAFSQLVQDRLNVNCHMYYDGAPVISRVAVAGGAYGDAAFFASDFGADALVTGEVKHHEILEGVAKGLVICAAEHYATEFPGLVALYRRFSQAPQFTALQEHIYYHSTPPFRGALR